MSRKSYIKVWNEHHGPIPNGKHIHHIDGNNSNNSIDNLICVSREMHAAFHIDRYDNIGLGKDAWAATLLGLPCQSTPWNKGKTMNSDFKNKVSKAMKGMERPNSNLNKFAIARSKTLPMLDKSTGIFYETYQDVADLMGITRKQARRVVKSGKTNIIITNG